MAKSLSTGIYEQIINKKIITQLADIDPKRLDIKDIDHAEAASILASYLDAIIKKSLEYTAETSTQDNPVNVPPPIEAGASCFHENSTTDSEELQRLTLSPQA